MTSHLSKGGGVVIGLDGSPGSRHALEWVLAHRARFAEEILPVMAYDLPITADGISPMGMLGDADKYRENANIVLQSEIERAGPALQGVTGTVGEGRPGSVLVDEAEGRDLLVVGCRGRSAMTEIVLGSVGSYCVMNSSTPVAIIPDYADATRPLSAIVVGVDGSDNSQAALQWALDHGAPDAILKAVGVFSSSPLSALGLEPKIDELERLCRDIVEKSIARLKIGELSPKVTPLILEGDPRNTLRTEAEKADLLVLGARGHEGVAHLLLGSVATSLTHHPTVATVVVPAHQ